jgi:hypothetical protein
MALVKMNGRSIRAMSAAALALCLAFAGGCASKPSYYRNDVAAVEPGSRVAVLPLVNLTHDVNAPDVVMNAFVVELLATHRFTVVDPGVVDHVIQQERIRLTDRLPLETLQSLGAKLGVDYLFVGSVNEYQITKEAQDHVPTVSVSMRMVSCSTSAIAWASTHSVRGNDRESVFTLGRISNLEELTSVVAHEMAQTLIPKHTKKQEKSTS